MEETDSSCYLVLELVEGETLADRLERGPQDDQGVARRTEPANVRELSVLSLHRTGVPSRRGRGAV